MFLGYVFIDLREKYQCEKEALIGVFPVPALTRDRTCNLGVWPDRESNLPSFGVWGDILTNSATQPGQQGESFKEGHT